MTKQEPSEAVLKAYQAQMLVILKLPRAPAVKGCDELAVAEYLADIKAINMVVPLVHLNRI